MTILLRIPLQSQISEAACRLAGDAPKASIGMLTGMDREEYEEMNRQLKIEYSDWYYTVDKFKLEIERFLLAMWTWFPLFVEYEDLNLSELSPETLGLSIDFNNQSWSNLEA